MGDKVSAMKDYQKAISLNPKYALAHFNAATLFFYNGQFEQVKPESILTLFSGRNPLKIFFLLRHRRLSSTAELLNWTHQMSPPSWTEPSLTGCYGRFLKHCRISMRLCASTRSLHTCTLTEPIFTAHSDSISQLRRTLLRVSNVSLNTPPFY